MALAPDRATALQVKVSELAGVYTNALGNLQNEAGRPDGGNVEGMARDLARELVQVHRDVETLIDQLAQEHCTEAAQLAKLETLQAQHAEVTQQLRAETQAAESVRSDVRQRLSALLEDMSAADHDQEQAAATAGGSSSGRAAN